MGIWSFGRGLIDDVYVLLILKVVEIEIPPFSIILYGERGTHLLKEKYHTQHLFRDMFQLGEAMYGKDGTLMGICSFFEG